MTFGKENPMFEVFEHTADIGIIVRAASLEQLFKDAAEGMITLICQGPDPENQRQRNDSSTAAKQTSRPWQPKGSRPSESRDIEIGATGCLALPEIGTSPAASHDDVTLSSVWEDLLHDWLSTILYIFSAEHLIPVDYDIRFDSDRLKARIDLRRYNPEKDGGEIEIKAVTYHGIRVEKRGGEFVAQVIFDT